ncbi:MAG: glycine dehydrogenase [Candidatus Endobugula sp.]|jgi:glycine dehydrogenase
MTENNEFSARHIGPGSSDQQAMLATLGYDDMATFISDVVPAGIHSLSPLNLGKGLSEQAAIAELRGLAQQNKVYRSLIGQGYYGSFTPYVIQRNLLENPAWYTAYTPYQPEISQGRLEGIINFQTMITDLTGMDLSSASLLDEGTAAAESMALCKRMAKSKSQAFFIDENCFPQTIEVVKTRAKPLGIEIVVGDPLAQANNSDDYFGWLLQYPGANGEIRDFSALINTAHEHQSLVVMAADILSLLLLKSPGDTGADVAIGCTQRFGIPLGFGGPHAAYMATREAFKRSLPGRLVGASQDSHGKPAYRLALQTREQHIRREKATSNICTAQVLLAVIAGMYAAYHGPQGLRIIAERVHRLTGQLASGLTALGYTRENNSFFDTLTVTTGDKTASIHTAARSLEINLREVNDHSVGISLDETCNEKHVGQLLSIFADNDVEIPITAAAGIDASMSRTDAVLTHPVFNRYHSETEMMRYLRKLADKDIALDRAMIPLGSCTMKLNASAEMIPISWPEFSNIHPFVPADQVIGYKAMIEETERMLCEITGYDAMSLQPNSGAQGEYAGLLAIEAYHASRGEDHRNICLIPSSAHGTNPASAQLCGMRVVVVKCDNQGNVDLQDLSTKAEECSENLAALMVTYPSTHGVFEEAIQEVCDIIHGHGGQVYIDGANLNAMVGVCQPGQFGGDVSHLNLHKTFCIPHGGGGPGVGPIGVGKHLEPFLPGHYSNSEESVVGAVASAAWGSASILPITWMYIKMMGAEGLKNATEVAILNGNYIAKKLSDAYPVLYTGRNDLIAHECIIDLRSIKDDCGVSVDDVAKRLIDYGFHAPTMSFPVSGTLMIEPTESESKVEIDRFIHAMLMIRQEIAEVESGAVPVNNNVLSNAPHTAEALTADEWDKPYTRTQAAYPIPSLKASKYWAPVGRLDNAYGDKNLQCSCLPISAYE